MQNDNIEMKKYYFKCPKCGSDAEFRRVREQSSGLLGLMILLGHFILALALLEERRSRVQCASCGYVFHQPVLRRSSVSNLAISMIALVLFFVFVAILMGVLPELVGLSEDVGWADEYGIVSVVEGFVERNPQAVAISAILMVVCIVVVCLVVSFVSNRRMKQKIKLEYEIKPKPYSTAGDKGSGSNE